MGTDQPFSASCERNKDPILAELQRHFRDRHHVLEIGSGTGQHAVHFARHMPWLVWQATDADEHLPGINMWIGDAGLPNLPGSLPLRAVVEPMPGVSSLRLQEIVERRGADGRSGFDAVFSANTLHIMGWHEVEALFAGLPTVLRTDGDVVLAIYGPFNRDGQFTSQSNREFDAWLKARDPVSGIRDFEAVDALARAQGWSLCEDVEMAANNALLVWQRE